MRQSCAATLSPCSWVSCLSTSQTRPPVYARESNAVDLNNLPSEALHCGRCGTLRPWTDYTLTALDRASSDGDPRLVCPDCRRAETERRRPISRQVKAKRETLRLAESRAIELQAAIDSAAPADIWSPSPHSPAELTRRLGETQRAILRHRAELAALETARANGATQRIAINRRTSRYGRPAIPSSFESIHP